MESNNPRGKVFESYSPESADERNKMWDAWADSIESKTPYTSSRQMVTVTSLTPRDKEQLINGDWKTQDNKSDQDLTKQNRDD